jgi:hypothetical protein
VIQQTVFKAVGFADIITKPFAIGAIHPERVNTWTGWGKYGDLEFFERLVKF